MKSGFTLDCWTHSLSLASSFGLGLALSVGLVACSAAPNPSAGVKLKIPWVQADGSYQLQDVPVYSLKDLSHLQGDAADIRVDADITPTSFTGPLALFQFTQVGAGGGIPTFVPTDTVSLEMAALYAQAEYIRNFDISVGAGDLIPYPRKIALMDQASVTDGIENLENNAMYLGASDATIIVKYGLDQLPISVNAGILAHEHFHALFQAVVLNPLGKTSQTSLQVYGKFGAVPEPSAGFETRATFPIQVGITTPPSGMTDEKVDPTEADLYNTVLIRGINEGFADVWGWLYSGQPSFIYNSLPAVKIKKLVDRSLNAPAQPILPMAELRNTVLGRLPRYKDPAQKSQVLTELTNYSYWQGAHYARFIYALIKLRNGIPEQQDFVSPEIRAQAGRDFLSVLTVLRDQLLTNAKTNTELSVVFPLVEAMKALSPNQTHEESGSRCALLRSTLPPVVLSADDSAQVKSVCPASVP